MNKKIVILGSTGSIGTQTLEVCRKMNFKPIALTANRNFELLEKQAREFLPRFVVCKDIDKAKKLRENLKDTDVEVWEGEEGIERAAQLPCDIVLNSLVGIAGLIPTMKAIETGHDIALANKETLVTGGKIITEAAKKQKIKIYPVDSEHSAIFQCLQGAGKNKIAKIILTASGGPFFGKTYEELEKMSAADALKHPNWDMGAKITIDSATLMNKAFEFIEAMWLFDLKPEQIEVVVHRESIIHSAVEYEDGSVIAQMGCPDMKIPIQYALTYPDRFECDVKKLSFTDIGKLTFYKPDTESFKCLKYGIEAVKKKGLYPCAINGANEKAVELFLGGKVGFNDISRAAKHILNQNEFEKENFTLEDVINTDKRARIITEEFLLNRK